MRHIIIILFIICSCTDYKESDQSKEAEDLVEYASGFEIFNYGKIHKLLIKKPFPGALKDYEYWIVPRGVVIPDSLKNEIVIKTPIEKLVVTSTSHLPMLDYLDEQNSLIGFPSLNYISSEKIRQRITQGNVAELGRDNSLNFEVLVELNPELLITYQLTGDRNSIERIQNAGIKVLINGDYLEQHPLGRAEWIKVGGLLFNKYTAADSIFRNITGNYNRLKNSIETSENAPSVLTGIMYGDTWYLPGGRNYAAILFKDAGMDYLWKDNEETGFLELSFETVYTKAKSADFWIGTASFEGLADLRGANSHYSWFDAFKTGNIYTYTKRASPEGGNDYLEQGYLRPDLILKDLIKIVHPDLFKDEEFYFYKKLENNIEEQE